MGSLEFNNLDQLRAKFAAEKVGQIIENHKSDTEFLEKYKTRAKNFGSIVREDLLQGLVFYFSKQNSSDKSFKVFLEQVTEWFRILSKEGFVRIEINTLESPQTFIRYLTTISAFEYLTITNETIQIGQWFKRFVDALIDVEGEK